MHFKKWGEFSFHADSAVPNKFLTSFLRSDEHDVELPRGVSGLSVPRGHPRFDVGIPSGSNDPLW